MDGLLYDPGARMASFVAFVFEKLMDLALLIRF
jgi:hypothetical protein